jgi:hypothetical protein
MTRRKAPNVNEKGGFSGFAHFSTLSQACFMSVSDGLISRLVKSLNSRQTGYTQLTSDIRVSVSPNPIPKLPRIAFRCLGLGRQAGEADIYDMRWISVSPTWTLRVMRRNAVLNVNRRGGEVATWGYLVNLFDRSVFKVDHDGTEKVAETKAACFFLRKLVWSTTVKMLGTRRHVWLRFSPARTRSMLTFANSTKFVLGTRSRGKHSLSCDRAHNGTCLNSLEVQSSKKERQSKDIANTVGLLQHSRRHVMASISSRKVSSTVFSHSFAHLGSLAHLPITSSKPTCSLSHFLYRML